MNKNQIINTLAYENYGIKMKMNELMQTIANLQFEITTLKNTNHGYDCSGNMVSITEPELENLHRNIEEKTSELDVMKLMFSNKEDECKKLSSIINEKNEIIY